MNRNSNARFELAPQAGIERSTFDRSVNVKTSFNVGSLIPFYVDEVLPGDTFEIQTSKVLRLQTLITPVMDNLYLDTYYFFVPNRLVWSHWRELCGENTSSPWTQTVEYTVPQVTAPSGGWNVGTIADYMGIPTGVDGFSVNAMPFRAYALICNEWFRDENLVTPFLVPTGDATASGLNDDSVNSAARGGLPFVAAKYHDYFTSCLPAPQKGPDASLLDSHLPVYSIDSSVPPLSEGSIPLRFNTDVSLAGSPTLQVSGDSYDFGYLYGTDSFSVGQKDYYLYPDNLFAAVDVDRNLTINSLRQAFQIQRLYEKDARGGTRYIELLKSHFGVESPDSRLQRPEYLGGNRVPLNIEQVLQTSSTDSTSPLGTTSGWSQTDDVHFDVRKSFTEHGFIIGLCVARYDHSYQQGLERFWSRKSRFDYYWPVLAHLGEQPVFNKEIFISGDDEVDNGVFGYQEAWADYRYKPNYITGYMRSAAAQSLDVWHFADNYASQPFLSSDWIKEDKTNVDRTLAVSSALSDTIFGDIFVQNRCTRPMPLYSIPGLVDHF